jgi:hypothetical protein
MDETLLFRERPEGLALPALDRFRAENFQAAQAIAPEGCTWLSVPALLTGKRVLDARAISDSDLMLRWADGSESPWSAAPGLFSESRQLGARAAVAGYFHPYCRLFRSALDQCSSLSSLEFAYGGFPFLPLTLRAPWAERDALIHEQNGIKSQTRALDAATDPSLDLVYLHLPMPRPPGLSAAVFGKYSEAAYLSNARVADEFFARLRLRLESVGLWEKTAVLLTSDHGYRDFPEALRDRGGFSQYLQVPFLVKLAGPSSPATFAVPFSTLALKEVGLGLLSGKIDSYPLLSDALRRNAPLQPMEGRAVNEYCKLPKR